MRILVAAIAAIVMLGSANAQSLEQTYADLCSDPAKAKSESCVALAQALVAKLQGRAASAAPPIGTGAAAGVRAPDADIDTANAALWRQRWGVLHHMVDKPWSTMSSPGYVTSYQWKVPGAEMVWNLIRPDGTIVKSSTTTIRWDEANRRIVPTTGKGDYYMVAHPDGSVMTLNTKQGEQSVRSVIRLLADGSIERVVEEKKGDTWVQQSRTVTGERTPDWIALERQQEIAGAQEERRKQRERSQQRAAMFHSIVQGVAHGMAEVDTGGYAEAQANLDATVANINAAAAMERQQQALAQQQEQARGAEQQRQQLAENARWVAEKEQAAAEYRAGQVDAAAAREAKLVAQQQADQQRRASAAAESRSAEQAAAVKRQQTQAAALAERPTIAAQPAGVAQGTHTKAANQAPQAPSRQTASGGSTQLYVFFIVLGGQTVAFEGPLSLTLAESELMEARLRNEAPSKYGAGATVDRRWRGPGTCLFVYQIPGEPLYKLGSGNGAVDTERSKNGQISNGKATIHRDVVCPHNN